MELDEASLAIGRIERALSRLEKSWTGHVLQPDLLAPAGKDEDQAALRAEVVAVIGELDALIAEAKRG